MTSPKNFLRVQLTDEQWEYINRLREKFGFGFVSPWVRGLIDTEMVEDEHGLTVKENYHQVKLEEIQAKKEKLTKVREKSTAEGKDKEAKMRKIALDLIDQAIKEPDMEKARRLCTRAYRAGILLKEMKAMIPPELHKAVVSALSRQVR